MSGHQGIALLLRSQSKIRFYDGNRRERIYFKNKSSKVTNVGGMAAPRKIPQNPSHSSYNLFDLQYTTSKRRRVCRFGLAINR